MLCENVTRRLERTSPFGESGKRGRIVDSNVGQTLRSISMPAFLRPCHEHRVRHPVLVRARVDADDPQLPEITLLVLAIAVRVFPTALDVLLRCLP